MRQQMPGRRRQAVRHPELQAQTLDALVQERVLRVPLRSSST
jgi:hypothetical protein